MISARFIGIDHFLDVSVPDLTGCVRDATALYSIFVDGMPGLDARLIANESATIDCVRRAVSGTLENAAEEDTVILSFATHGTHDHRLVAYDSNMADIPATTLDLDDLVAHFRATRARFVFIILDCCFAGAAPARVVSDSPHARGIFDIHSIHGAGRLILAASRMDQQAYEHPTRRHGLLTGALLDALTQAQVGIMSMVESVIARVRADAASIGVVQDPVTTTFVEGGFHIPTLVRGELYGRNFPEYGAIRTVDIDGITAFGIPADVVALWRDDFGNHLHQLQLDAVNEYRVLNQQSLFVVAPTSSGKTFVGELAAVKAIREGRKAVFLLPYKALVSEKFEDFSYKYGDRLGLRVIRCNSDFRDQTSEFVAGKFDIGVLTYEMFLGLTVTNPAVLNLIGLVVVDEAQFIANEDRGITVELILTFLRMNRSKGIDPQLVLLSAVLGNVTQFGEWLDLRTLVSDHRPVPLEFGVLDRFGIYQYMDAGGVERIAQLLNPAAIVQRRDKPSAQDILVPLLQKLLETPTERALVFRSRRGETEGSSQYLARELGFPPAQGPLDALPAADPSLSSPLLRAALEGGVAFHDSNLNAQERAVVEHFFRDRDGGIRVLTATSGVAAGINTPASTAVIVETEQPRQGSPAMFSGDVRNMAGRAGRYGYQETGRAIILAGSSIDRQRLFANYVASPPEDIRSSFDGRDVTTWLLRLLRQVGRVPRTDAPALIVNTFGGYLITRRDVNAGAHLAAQTRDILDRMLAAGLLDETVDGVSLTMLGNACGLSSLSFDSCLRLIESARRLGAVPLTPESLLVMLQQLREGDAVYVPMQRRGTAEGRWEIAFIGTFGYQLGNEVARFAADKYELWARHKRALITMDWISGRPIAEIERTFSVNRFNSVGAGDVRGIAESTRFRLRSVYDIVAAAMPGSSPRPEEMDDFFTRLEFGIPAEALYLLNLHANLARAEMVSVLDAGFTASATLDVTSREELLARLPLELVNKVKPTDA